MEEKIEKTQEQLNEERFIASFAYAMEVYAKKHREAMLLHGELKRNAYDRLKADGHWDAEWLAGQYVRIATGVCDLPFAIRRFIVFIAKGAQEKFDSNDEDDGKEEKQEEKANEGKGV